jgi:hypothetical protein
LYKPVNGRGNTMKIAFLTAAFAAFAALTFAQAPTTAPTTKSTTATTKKAAKKTTAPSKTTATTK